MLRESQRQPRSLGLGLVLIATAAPLFAEIDADLLGGFKARSIGPAGMSGRIAVIEAVDSNPDIVYVGAATGGVWKSTNGGVSFEPLFDDQPVHAIGSIAVYQKNPDIVWVGTGEGNLRNSASVGNGIYKSLDGGRTWKHLGLDQTEHLYRIRLDPTDPGVAYACATGQEWGENSERGVFKTADGGQSWNKILYVDEKTGCGDLVIDPVNPNKLIASMWQFRRWPYFFKSGGPGSGLYVTYDGGASWKKLQQEDGLPEGELGRIGLAISHSNPEVIYAMVEAQKSALLRSEDGGKSWKKVNQKTNVAARPFYFADLRVDPAWPNRIYSLDFQARVSNDGGKSFERLAGATWAMIHGDFQAMWINPGAPTQIYIGDDGGMAESRDRGKSFRFVGNLPLAQYYHVAVDQDVPYHIYGGLQDNGSWRGPSSLWQDGGIRNHHWKVVGGGDGFDTRPDPKDSSQGYSMWQGGNLMRWNLRSGEQRSIKPPEPEGTRLRFNWNAGFAIDPFDSNTIYLGSQFVHRSTDRGETWTILSPDLTTNNPEWQKAEQSGGLTLDATNAENHTTLIAIAPSPLAQGVVWVGSDDGRIHVTRDGGANWSSVEKNVHGVPADTWIPHIEPSKFDAAAAFVVFDNHRRSDWTPYIYKTTDYGQSWSSLAGPKLRGYCLAVAQDPVQPDLLFLGTEFGLFVSLDGGTQWTALKKSLPTASVMDLMVHPREHDLVVGTHGRALYVLDDIRPLRSLSEATLTEPLHLFEVAPAQQHWNQEADGGFGFGAGEFRGDNRPYGAILAYSLNLPGLPLQDEEKERARKETERAAERVKPSEEQPASLESAPESEETKAEEKPKVVIEVADGSGRLIRTFKGPANLGVNRAPWGFERDAFKQPPRAEEEQDPLEEPKGPQVPPGTYTVKVKYDQHEASQSIQVLADPRSNNTAEDWQNRWDTILQAGALNDTAVAAILRLRRTRDDIGVVQEKVRQAAQDAGEKDQKKIEEQPLIRAGKKIKNGLTQLEKRLWQAPEAKGLSPDTDVFSKISFASMYLLSSWDPPSPTHLAYLQRAQTQLEGYLGDFNKFLDTEVADFRKQVEEAHFGLLPVSEPITLKGGKGSR